MNKIVFLRSLIAGCATIMQIWIAIVIYNNDYLCRTGFSSSNSSIGNQQECISTLNDFSQWHCTCRYFSTTTICEKSEECIYIEYWMRVFDDWSVALASFVFIPLVIIESWRSWWMIQKIFGNNDTGSTSFDFCSPFGFLAMILNPSCFNIQIPSTHEESFMVIIDGLSIGLIFQYCAASKTSISVPFILITLISSCCNGVGYLLNLYILNYQHQVTPPRT